MDDKTMDFKALKILLIDEHIRLETMLNAIMSKQERTINKIEDLNLYIRQHSCSVCEKAKRMQVELDKIESSKK